MCPFSRISSLARRLLVLRSPHGRGFAGTVFGELAALGLNTRRTMKVVCEEDAEVLILSSSDIKRIFEGRPEARLSLRLCAGGSCIPWHAALQS